MDLFLFRNEFFYFGVPIKDSAMVTGLDSFVLRPSGISSTLWNFENSVNKTQGFILHFSNCITEKKCSFDYCDKLFFSDSEKKFAILFNGFLGKLENFTVRPDEIKPYEFKSDRYNHFIRIFLNEAILYHREHIFLIRPEKIFSGYQHIL